ncbi:glycosyltransferase [bacterium]|nr:glycosyltransferase [bacterium]
MRRNKVLFVIYSIYGGGAEKQMQYILEYIDRNRFEPHLAVFHLSGKEKTVVPEDVNVYDLSTMLRPASLFLVFKLMGLIRKVRPDIILSFTWGVNIISVLAALVTRVKIMISERITPSLDFKDYLFPRMRRIMIKIFYPKTEKIIANSFYAKRDLSENFNVKAEKIEVIHNGIDAEKINRLKDTYELGCGDYVLGCGDYVLACGSLNRRKNYDFLIEVMSGIKGFSLVILGEGPLKAHLASKARSLGVNLILPGFAENPYPYFKRAKLFALTSLYEGFPNVILEAMAIGVPVVAVDCPGGIRELIKNGENGMIIRQDGMTEMAEVIKMIREEPEFARKLAKNALDKVSSLKVLLMVKKYESLIG